MVIDVSLVTDNKIRGRNNSLSVRARAYSNIRVNPLVIKGDTWNIIDYSISTIICSVKRSIYYLNKIASYSVSDLTYRPLSLKKDNYVGLTYGIEKQPQW